MNRRQFTFGFCSCAAAALAACATDGTTAPTTSGPLSAAGNDLQPLIAPGYRPTTATDEGDLWRMMQRQESDIQQSRFLVKNQDLTAYVHEIACRLLADRCPDVRTYIIRTAYFNASMAPNGMMQVWSGLLLRMHNEAQLAAIIGHECGHYLRQHALQRWREARSTTDVAAFLSLGLGAAGGAAGASLAQLIAAASVMSFSRDQEREADAYGLQLMSKAGYAPLEASKVWSQLIAETKASTASKHESILFATHPQPEERLATLRTAAERMIAAGGTYHTYRERLHEHMKPAMGFFLKDQLRLRSYGETEVLFDQLLAANGPNGQLLFFKGENYRLRNGSGDSAKALAAYDQALASTGAPPEIYRSIGLIRYHAKEWEKASAAFRHYLDLEPAAEDRLEIQSYIQGHA